MSAEALLPLTFFAVAIGSYTIAPLRRRKRMRAFAAQQHLAYLDLFELPFEVPVGAMSHVSFLNNGIRGNREGVEVFCCDSRTTTAILERFPYRGTIVAIHAIVRDLSPLRHDYAFAATSGGWTLICSTGPWVRFSAYMRPEEIATAWDRMRSLVRAEAVAEHTVTAGEHTITHHGDGLVIHPRHEVPDPFPTPRAEMAHLPESASRQ